METKTKKGRGSNPNSKKNLKPIQKGQVLNPLGGKAHDPVMKALKSMSKEVLKEIIDITFFGTMEQLEAMTKEPKLSPIEAGVARAIFNGVSKGDWHIIEQLLARTIGKVPDKTDITSNGQTVGSAFVLEIVDDGIKRE